jgi:hypothetical protein
MMNREEAIERFQRNRAALLTERKVEVRTYQVHADHNNCVGQFVATGEAYLTYPPKYIHVCSGCGQHESFKEKYPLLRTEPC